MLPATDRPTIAYQPHIDGLRAIAVLAVLLDHVGIGPFHGGFVGVDIFFVISGYLITGIVQRQIEQGRFTFAGFYERRIRRLFPALFVVLAVTMLAGLGILLPSDLEKLARGTVATLAFGSNILFWRESGYFDGASDFNPLLHTWSLAVEEQFYIVYPLLLLLAHRWAPRHLKLLLLMAAGVSLVAALVVQPSRPSAVFFLSPFRGWELLAGALLAVRAVPPVASRVAAESLSWLGLALLLGSVLWVQPGPGFPGWQALFPVVGTAILLHVGAGAGSVVHLLLRFKPLVFVGLISYSLYLWHWPLLVFTSYLNGMQPLGANRWWVLLWSLGLASVSYYWVEQPFRARPDGVPRRRLFQRTGWALAGLASLSLLVLPMNGLPARFPASAVALDRERAPVIPFRECINASLASRRSGDFCVIGDRAATPDMIVWGDSHALAWAPVFDTTLTRLGRSALLAMESSCPPLAGVATLRSARCRQVNDALVDHAARAHDLSTVVMIASWPSYAAGGPEQLVDARGRTDNGLVFPQALLRTTGVLQALGKHVWIIGPTPGAPREMPFRMAMSKVRALEEPRAIGLAEFSRRAAAFDSAMAEVLAEGSASYTDPRKWLCSADGICDYRHGAKLLYRDDGHLSVAGADYLQPFLEREMARFDAAAPKLGHAGPIHIQASAQ